MFGLLALFDVSLGVQLAFCIVLTLLWTGATVRQARREQEEYRRAHGLEPARRDHHLVARYVGALFVASLGFLMFGLCIVQTVANLAN